MGSWNSNNQSISIGIVIIIGVAIIHIMLRREAKRSSSYYRNREIIKWKHFARRLDERLNEVVPNYQQLSSLRRNCVSSVEVGKGAAKYVFSEGSEAHWVISALSVFENFYWSLVSSCVFYHSLEIPPQGFYHAYRAQFHPISFAMPIISKLHCSVEEKKSFSPIENVSFRKLPIYVNTEDSISDGWESSAFRSAATAWRYYVWEFPHASSRKDATTSVTLDTYRQISVYIFRGSLDSCFNVPAAPPSVPTIELRKKKLFREKWRAKSRACRDADKS